MASDAHADVRAMALRYLARREYGRRQLEEKLRQKGAESAVARDVVAELDDEDLVSDRRFAEAFVRDRVGRLQGPHKILAHLQGLRVDDAAIEEAMGPYEFDWPGVIRTWIRKRASGAKPDRDERARLYRGGTARGFSHDQVLAAIDSLRRES